MFYYLSNGVTFTSKVHALKAAKDQNLPLNFYYYDDVYDKVNFALEPSMDIDSLYKMQAQRIRDTYDKVILMYSGGYDSSNILETYYYNNIPLDKIVIVAPFSKDSHSLSNENWNLEIYKNAFPMIEKLGLSNITQKYDFTTELFKDPYKYLSLTQYGPEWIHEIGSRFSTFNIAWHDIEKYIVPSEWETKRVAVLFGRDRPFVHKLINDIGYRFNDIGLMDYGFAKIKDNIQRINFYSDPTFPEILVKQLHLLNGDMNNVSNNAEILYNLKNKLNYKNPKSKSVILSYRDTYMLNAANTEIYNFYKDGILNLNSYVSVRDVGIPIYSKMYKLT